MLVDYFFSIAGATGGFDDSEWIRGECDIDSVV